MKWLPFIWRAQHLEEMHAVMLSRDGYERENIELRERLANTVTIESAAAAVVAKDHVITAKDELIAELRRLLAGEGRQLEMLLETQTSYIFGKENVKRGEDRSAERVKESAAEAIPRTPEEEDRDLVHMARVATGSRRASVLAKWIENYKRAKWGKSVSEFGKVPKDFESAIEEGQRVAVESAKVPVAPAEMKESA